MEFEGFLELLKKRRSIRRFKPDPVPEEYIRKILESARWAMSGANAQPWEFIVVTKQETKNKMAETFLEVWKEQHAIEMTRIEALRHPHSMLATPTFKDAPVLIVVIGDRRTFQATVMSTSIFNGEGGPGGVFYKNMANPVQIMHLAAAALGIGSEWFSTNQLWAQSIKSILKVPEVLEVHSIVVLGYPAYAPPPTYRRELKEIVHYEEYDRSKLRSGEEVVEYIRFLRQQSQQAYEKQAEGYKY